MTSKYLYDIEPSDFKNMIYEEAIKYKYDLAKKLHKELNNELEEFYKTGKKYDDVSELRERMFWVWRAVAHNKMLIDEME